MLCFDCWVKINPKDLKEQFLIFASGDWRHLRCYEKAMEIKNAKYYNASNKR
jgi:hypothetical protein